jgi:hypothetical protein
MGPMFTLNGTLKNKGQTHPRRAKTTSDVFRSGPNQRVLNDTIWSKTENFP